MNVLDALTGKVDAGYALELMDGLLSIPDSLYRARFLTDNPQEPDPTRDPKVLGLLGWSQDTRVLLGMHNLLAALAAGKEAEKHMLTAPGGTAPGGKRLLVKTLAEFTEAGFFGAMKQLEQGAQQRSQQ